ncbi:hypothetical protein BDW22DRAFT_1428602 [Trametopsis cervina]|nr:hypothetical protein BDW22DRAFT_1428602 [Trametopsis cervina]
MTAIFTLRRSISIPSHYTQNIRLSTLSRFARPVRPFSSSSPITSAQYRRFEIPEGGPHQAKQWTTGGKILAGLTAFGGVYYVAHLEQVPETGRWRFMTSNPQFEAYIAERTRQSLLQEYQKQALPPNHPLTIHVHNIVNRILEANDLGVLKTPYPSKVLSQKPRDPWDPDSRSEDVPPEAGGREWELIVVDDMQTVNALAAFGNIVVFTGILPVAKDEQGLAAILGHEIGHVVARHNQEQLSAMKVLVAVSALVSLALSVDFGITQYLYTLLLELPRSRTMEFEADEIGLKLMSKACYDPKAAPKMHERLGKIAEGAGGGFSFMRTHPASTARVERLQDKLPEALSIRAATPRCAGILDKLYQFRNSFGSR